MVCHFKVQRIDYEGFCDSRKCWKIVRSCLITAGKYLPARSTQRHISVDLLLIAYAVLPRA